MSSIFVAGGITVDSLVYLETFPQPIGQTIFSKGFHETIGGTGAGKALNLNRLGLGVMFHCVLGDDPHGRLVREYFAREALNFIYDIDPQGTETHINLMADSGERISIYARYATFEPQIELEILEFYIAAADVVVINIINYCRHLLPLAKRHHKPVWVDVHDYDGKNPYHQDFINAADYLFLSSEKLPNYRPVMTQLIPGRQLVVCTHGKQGSTALTAAGEWIETPALSYPMKDTNGAGDSFFAGVLYGTLKGYPPQVSLRLGTLVGGLCVTSAELFFTDLSETRLLEEYAQQYGTLDS